MNNYKPGTLRHARAELSELRKKVTNKEVTIQVLKHNLELSEELISRVRKEKNKQIDKYNLLKSDLKALPWYIRLFLPETLKNL